MIFLQKQKTFKKTILLQCCENLLRKNRIIETRPNLCSKIYGYEYELQFSYIEKSNTKFCERKSTRTHIKPCISFMNWE